MQNLRVAEVRRVRGLWPAGLSGLGSRLVSCFLIAAAALAVPAESAIAEEVLIEGLAWRQLTDTTGAQLSWNDVASVCPQNEMPCTGSVKGVDFTGWTWASFDRVQAMLETLTGFNVPTDEYYESPLEVFFDSFDAPFDNASMQIAFGLYAGDAAMDTLEPGAIKVQDAKGSAGSDDMTLTPITATAVTVNSFFGPQPFGVFLVRDPELELCANGRDDDADGLVDGLDPDCPAGGLENTAVEQVAVGDEPAISPDGTVVVFECSVVPFSLCLHDLRTGETQTIASTDGPWEYYDSEFISLSNGGEFVAIGGKLRGAARPSANVYVRATGEIQVVSRLQDGAVADGWAPRITPDGRHVVFISGDDLLVPDDSNNDYDTFIYDRQTGIMELVSRTPDGRPSGNDGYRDHWQPAVSDDGNLVVFNSRTALLSGDTTSPNLYMANRSSGTLRRVNLRSNGQEPYWTSPQQFNISGDGRFVAWIDGDGRDTVSPELSGANTLFLRDLQSRTTTLVYKALDGSEPAGSDNFNPTSRLVDRRARVPISTNGTILLMSDAPDLVENDGNGSHYDIFAYDRRSDRNWVVSLDPDGQPFTGTKGTFGPQYLSHEFDISADGQVITYSDTDVVYVARLDPLGAPTPESCGNSFDDDGDGLIDLADFEDCPGDLIGLTVRCTHDPVYLPEVGGVATIRAQAIDEDGNPTVVQRIEIWLGSDRETPQQIATGAAETSLEFPPTGDFYYGCRAETPRESSFSGWRGVRVGSFDADFPAVPVFYNGPLDEKIDIVFFPDRDEYASPTDPEFIADVGRLIWDGYFTIPWFAEHQQLFNFWIGRDVANSGLDPDSDRGSCLREAPDGFKSTYSFADSAGIVHRSACRDNAGWPGLFTIEIQSNRLQVVAHETGHRPFGLADEYSPDGGYYTRKAFAPPYPNLFLEEAGCRRKAEARGFDPEACRGFLSSSGRDWWLFEADKNTLAPQPADLMQGTGCDSLSPRPSGACTPIEATRTATPADPNGLIGCAMAPADSYRGDPDGVPHNTDDTYWVCRKAGSAADAEWTELSDNFFDRYDVSDSERDRMRWFVQECRAGRC